MRNALRPRIGNARRARIAEAARHLLAYPNVTHLTLGRKIVGGRRTRMTAVKVHVTAKGKVSGEDEIPGFVIAEGRSPEERLLIPTDIVESPGRTIALGVRSGDQLRAFDPDIGIAGVGFRKNGIGYVLTNAHVVANIATGMTGPVRRYDPATGQILPLGDVVYCSPLISGAVAKRDAALVRAGHPGMVDPWAVGGGHPPIGATDMIRTNPPHYWYVAHGVKYGCGWPEYPLHPRSVEFDQVAIWCAEFWQLAVTPDGAQPGHSGSLVCRTYQGKTVACGLLFAGKPGQHALVYSLEPMFDELFKWLP